MDSRFPVYNNLFKLRVDKRVKSVTLQPQNQAVNFEQKDGYISYVIPEINGYQMVVIE